MEYQMEMSLKIGTTILLMMQKAIVNKAPITRNQPKVLKILSLLKEIPKQEKSDEQPDTTDMPELEEESAAERRNQKGKGLKIITPCQMLSRLPITLIQ